MYQNGDQNKKKDSNALYWIKILLRGRGGIGRRASFRYSYLMVWEFKSPRPHQVILGT